MAPPWRMLAIAVKYYGNIIDIILLYSTRRNLVKRLRSQTIVHNLIDGYVYIFHDKNFIVLKPNRTYVIGKKMNTHIFYLSYDMCNNVHVMWEYIEKKPIFNNNKGGYRAEMNKYDWPGCYPRWIEHTLMVNFIINNLN